jgi:hypothetical protein
MKLHTSSYGAWHNIPINLEIRFWVIGLCSMMMACSTADRPSNSQLGKRRGREQNTHNSCEVNVGEK